MHTRPRPLSEITRSLIRRLAPGLLVSLLVVLLALPGPLRADAKRFRLAAPAALLDSGLLAYLLPRFSLKTGVRITVVGITEAAEITLGTATGQPVFRGVGALWRMDRTGDHPGAARFAGWLVSGIGQRTVTSYEVDGRAPFRLPAPEPDTETSPVFHGDAALGKRVSLAQCGRCHVVAPENRMKAIGSTPSFAVLRAMSDWDTRFLTFHTLNPHPAFTQITGVTPPFPVHRPPPIVPIRIHPDDLDAILAYVSDMPPADLGAPLQFQ